jgi:hypothetical protein
MQIKRRQRLAAGDDARCAFDPRQERLQVRLHLKHDPGAGARQQRHIAHELERVAEPLLGMEEDRLAT